MMMKRMLQLLALTVLLLLSGCGGKYSNVKSETTYGNSAVYQSAVTYDRGEMSPIAPAPMVTERIIHKEPIFVLKLILWMEQKVP